MAIGATIHTFEVQLADVDRSVYDEISLRVARHPSETDLFMVTRLLAYCLEYEEGIAFSAGVSTTDEPAVLVRDLTGAITAWIEIGAPDADRLHFGSKLADRAAVYTHRDAEKLMGSWAGKTIHASAEIPVFSFDAGFVGHIAAALARRNTMAVSRTEGELYVDINGVSLTSAVHTHEIS